VAVTMRDVANAAGVSPMTVSNVLRDVPTVDEELRARVLRAVDELGYELSLTARQLRSGRSGLVTVIGLDINDPYFSALASSLAAGFASEGIHCVIEQSRFNPGGERGALTGAHLKRFDGVVLSSVGLSYEQMDSLDVNLPLVIMGEHEAPPRFDHIMMANIDGSRQAVEHLLASGCRRVMMLGGSETTTTHGMAEARTAGWRQAHSEAGLVADEALVIPTPHYTPTEARTLVAEHLRVDRSIDGIFAVADAIAIGALAGARDVHREVPTELQVVGFDNLAIDTLLNPALSSVDPGMDWMSQMAVRLLRDRIASHGAEHESEHLVSPARLVVRESSGRSEA